MSIKCNIEKLINKAGWDNKPAYASFVPGRINITEYMDMLRSRQVSMALDKGIWSISKKRDDGIIRVKMEAYGKEEYVDLKSIFSFIRENRKNLTWKEFIYQNPHFLMVRGNPLNYVLAPIIRMIYEMDSIFGIKGYEIFIEKGQIPMESGLSTSSAVVVSSGWHFTAHNPRFEMPGDKAVIFGEGEWYTGTRGGFNDHATIIYGRAGSLLINDHKGENILTDYVKARRDMDIYIFNSLFNAAKTKGALEKFNNIKADFLYTAEKCSKYIGSKNILEIGEFRDEQIRDCIKAQGMDRTIKRILSFYLFQKEFIIRFQKKQQIETGDMFKIHWNISRALKNSNEYIDYIIRNLEITEGIIGAKTVGAGFGGSIIIFAEKNIKIEDILKNLLGGEKTGEKFLKTLKAQVKRPEIIENMLQDFRKGNKKSKELITRVNIGNGGFICDIGEALDRG